MASVKCMLIRESLELSILAKLVSSKILSMFYESNNEWTMHYYFHMSRFAGPTSLLVV